jgi:sec-independent protein translocase protein TatA
MMGLKMPELLIILLVLLLLFGATRLPQLGASLGASIRNFKKGFSGDSEGAGPEADKKDPNLMAGRTQVPAEPGKSTTREG